MKLITRIETNYFRSIYSEIVKNLSDCNVFIGANDCGKSNFLRALNLFFNNQTGYHEAPDFLQDVTHFRQNEAKTSKGRLTIWMKVHFTNQLGWSTLPQKFWIKKTWNRYSDDPEITSNIKTKTALTKFLNKTEFHYVPAVKERDIFSDYLILLYQTLAESSDIKFDEPATNLSNAIHAATLQLSGRIQDRLGVRSQISIPSNFQSIFERLEFTTKQDDVDVPLANRGDGIQVRHIPHILDYVSQNNKKLNIWGYEEPENSLEMSNCFDLAKQFSTVFCKNNQLFITSHSPAFYGLDNSNSNHYLVRKIKRYDGDTYNEVTEIKEVADRSVVDEELGIAQLLVPRMEEAVAEMNSLRQTVSILKELSQPVVLTEGITDEIVLNVAWSKLYPNTAAPFIIKSCDVSDSKSDTSEAGADQLQRVLEATTGGALPKKIGLFDNDIKGIKCFRSLRKHKKSDFSFECKVNSNHNSAALLLPEVCWEDPYFEYTNRCITIEMMFPRKLFSSEDIVYSFIGGSGNLSKNLADKLINDLYEKDLKKLLQVKIKFVNKTDFAEKVKGFSKENFSSFSVLFENLILLLDELKK